MDRATVAVYEARAREWRARRRAAGLDRAHALARAVAPGAITADLGCGPGLHLPMLGRPTVALDAAYEMLRIAREAAADAWPVQADLEALPFRRGGLEAAWARASYLHIPRARLPSALAELHSAMAVGAPGDMTMHAGDTEGALADDDFPGRFFAGWHDASLREVFVGAGFVVEECARDETEPFWLRLRVTRARTLADSVGPDMRLLVCGLNPSLHAADAGFGFAGPGNRFWPAARAAGLVTRDRDARAALAYGGMGMTDLVKRATARADELTRDEYREGAARVRRLVEWLRPEAVCFVGLAGWRAAIDRRAVAGRQPDGFGGVPAYVMPSTSGLNARVPLSELTEHLRAAAALGATARTEGAVNP